MQSAAFTLWSSGHDVGFEAEKAPAAADAGVISGTVDKLNSALGDRIFFTQVAKPVDARRSESVFKCIDAHVAGLLSTSGGFAVMGDCGFDFVQFESPKFDLGVGFRVDTGLNVGKKGARVVWLGIGGELILAPDATAAATTPAAAEPKDASATDKLKEVATKVAGFGLCASALVIERDSIVPRVRAC